MALLPVLLGLLVTSWKGTSELRKAIGKNFEGLAKEAASKTDLAVQKEISELRHLVESDEVQTILSKTRVDPAKEPPKSPAPLFHSNVPQLLNRTVQAPGREITLQSLTLANNTGIQVASSSGAPEKSASLEEEAWWKESAKGGKGAVYLGNIYLTKSGGQDFLFDIAVSIFGSETGQFLGVLKATYHLKPFLKPFIFNIRFGSTGHAMLIDSAGVVLICPILPTGSHVTDPELLKAVTSDQPGWITAHNDGHGGTNSIVGFAPIEAVNHFVSAKGGSQWHSFIRQEPAETYTPVQSLLKTVFLSGSLLVGFTCVLGFMVSGKLVKPLLLLHEGAEHIRKGNLGHRLQIQTNDEIEALADKFNEMAEKLSELYATLEHKVMARTRELQALNQIATTANQSLELQGLLDSTLQKVIEVTPFESGYIELFDAKEDQFILKSHRGFTPDLLNIFLTTPESRKLSKEVVETHTPAILENAQDSTIGNPLISVGYRTFIAFPIQSKNKIIGIFTLASRTPHSFTAQDLQLLSSIGNQMGTALENANLYQKEQETVEKLMEMDRIKSEFLSNISHELRTPLTSIIGFSEILLDRLAGDLSTDQESFIKNMNTSGQYLLEIINNLLDLSKIKAGKMEIHSQRFSLRELLNTVQQTIIPMTYKKGLVFEINVADDIDLIYTDEGKMKQILLNLLGNAVKFTPAKGEINLIARKTRSAGIPAIEISVQDTGIGIPENALKKIFDEFQQIDGSYTRDYPGTGLGLAITKRFVEILKGEINVESHAGIGTTFKVVIPMQEQLLPLLYQEPPASMTRQEARLATVENRPVTIQTKVETRNLENNEGDRPKILVIEDDPAVSKLLALYLSQEGYSVIHAYDGEEALEKAQETKPFAITLDIMLPQIDGWEVLKKLKTLPSTRDIPVIIVSIVENPTLGFSLGAVDYFTKPIDRKGLVESIKKYSNSTTIKRKAMNVLVIEHPSEMMQQIGSILDEEQFGIIKTTRGEEGVALAIEIQPDLILLDITLENISGFETIQRLKQHPTAKNIPIILFASAELTPEEKQILDGQVREIVYRGPSLKETLIHEVKKFEKLYPDKAKMIDGLTGLYNERYLHNRLSDEMNRAFRYKRTFSLLLSNVDHFQQLNRRYGTETGDNILHEIALSFRKNSRASNPLCRCGGSTFALLMPETTKDSAKLAAEKLRRLVENHDFSVSEKQRSHIVTVSIGISTFFEDANTSEKMIIQAGTALRHAQALGGNRTMTLDKIELS
jgi:diguanylate cyclase (GGDEF)-like protein